MHDMTLYAYTIRSRAERVLWTLRELDFPHQVIRLDFAKGENNAPEFVQLNPSRKMPVLVHGDTVLTESLAIMEYLNDISENRPLIPAQPNEVYLYRKSVYYGVTEIEPYLWVADQATRLKEQYRWPDGTFEQAIKHVSKNVEEVWAGLEKQDYVIETGFSLADIYFYHLITWAGKFDLKYPPKVRHYLDRMSARTAFPAEMRP